MRAAHDAFHVMSRALRTVPHRLAHDVMELVYLEISPRIPLSPVNTLGDQNIFWRLINDSTSRALG